MLRLFADAAFSTPWAAVRPSAARWREAAAGGPRRPVRRPTRGRRKRGHPSKPDPPAARRPFPSRLGTPTSRRSGSNASSNPAPFAPTQASRTTADPPEDEPPEDGPPEAPASPGVGCTLAGLFCSDSGESDDSSGSAEHEPPRTSRPRTSREDEPPEAPRLAGRWVHAGGLAPTRASRTTARIRLPGARPAHRRARAVCVAADARRLRARFRPRPRPPTGGCGAAAISVCSSSAESTGPLGRDVLRAEAENVPNEIVARRLAPVPSAVDARGAGDSGKGTRRGRGRGEGRVAETLPLAPPHAWGGRLAPSLRASVRRAPGGPGRRTVSARGPYVEAAGLGPGLGPGRAAAGASLAAMPTASLRRARSPSTAGEWPPPPRWTRRG